MKNSEKELQVKSMAEVLDRTMSANLTLCGHTKRRPELFYLFT